MRRVAWILLLAACQAATPQPDPRPKPKPPKSKLPKGFFVKGAPRVEPPFLEPDATWRFLVSRLTTLRADARAEQQDVLVSFAKGAMHVTDRAGSRITWQFPKGLALKGSRSHLVLGADLTATVYTRNGAQVPFAEEVTVATVTLKKGGGPAEEIRLVVKGGRTFRSIFKTG